MLSQQQLEHFAAQGYLLIDSAVSPDLFDPLRQATARVTARTRRGEWPYKRDAGDGDIWGVSHLLHPDLGEEVFARYMATPEVLDVAADLLSVPRSDKHQHLQLELVNMLVNPGAHDHEIGWHRDLLRQDLPPAEEVTRLRELQNAIQWNTALYDEACLHIVPASHLRAKTPAERDIVFNRPTDSLPGQLAVELKAGQGVYYNANLLHRGVYERARQRETLHCCMGLIDGSSVRTYVYQTMAWMDDPDFGLTLPKVLRPLHDNFRKMAAQHRITDKNRQHMDE